MEKTNIRKKKKQTVMWYVRSGGASSACLDFHCAFDRTLQLSVSGCFLMQAAYTVAFRSAARGTPGRRLCGWQLNQLLEGEVLSFGKEERQIKAGMLRVEVILERETPLARLAAVGDRGRLKVKQTAYVRNAAAYIRGIRRGKELGDE